MEAIGVPWFITLRYLGPPLFLLVVGGTFLLWRRPARRGLAWAALVTNLVGAALPFLWIGLQILTDRAEQTVYGLVMTLLQPTVVMAAWLMLLAAVVLRPPVEAFVRTGQDGLAGAREEGGNESREEDGDREAERTPKT